MNDAHYDLIIIGAGPAGEGAAINAAKQGLRAAVVEDRPQVGGGCTHRGTIPSKALRHAVRQLITFNTNSLFRAIGDPKVISFPQVMQSAERVIRKQVKNRATFYARNFVDVHIGQARFVDSHQIEVAKPGGLRERFSADHFIIATGSRPYRPADIDFSHPAVFDSDTILELKQSPRRLIIYGAGVIGCEYASIFAGLGVKVELINSRDRLLSFLDGEITDALAYHLRDNGVLVRHEEVYSQVEDNGGQVVMALQSGKRVHADALLWCQGRTGNTDRLNLEVLGLEADGRGQLRVNQRYQTAVPHVFAVGDVIGWPSLAGAAYDQGRFAVDAVVGKDPVHFVDDVATGIYTLPEISSVGKTEHELTEAKVPYEVGRAFFKHIARAQISGDEVGVLKLLFHAHSREILGVHCFGAEAAEIVHIGQAIMRQPAPHNTLDYFVNTTFNYPTMAEAYRVAALNGINRLPD